VLLNIKKKEPKLKSTTTSLPRTPHTTQPQNLNEYHQQHSHTHIYLGLLKDYIRGRGEQLPEVKSHFSKVAAIKSAKPD